MNEKDILPEEGSISLKEAMEVKSTIEKIVLYGFRGLCLIIIFSCLGLAYKKGGWLTLLMAAGVFIGLAYALVLFVSEVGKTKGAFYRITRKPFTQFLVCVSNDANLSMLLLHSVEKMV
ncbi:MAG: hypothetical protein K0M45_10875 [Candidatus Paracaedibacteraceae bacterium]|nr:hypothetical protein [Candidatus Paracaedibacteraceae bacterium]